MTFDIHSPEQEIHLPLFAEKQIRVFIKRDDQIHPYISGNKWRKLKHTLEQAKLKRKKTLVTFGGAWSNHLLATACAGATFGFETYGFVRGEMVENPVLSFCQLFGMKLIFVSREEYKNKALLFEQKFGSDTDAVFINEGGYGTDALYGCSELIRELQNNYDAIFCAAGTGSTAAGLQKGIQQNQMNTQLHVVPILKGDFIPSEIVHLGIDSQRITFHSSYHFGGYAKTKPELLRFIQSFVSKTGIMIEPTYTGKCLYALFDLVKKDYFKPNSKILFIHTGGLTGLLGMYQRFDFKTI